jgi:hypothetical protein
MSIAITLDFGDPAKIPALLATGKGANDPELRKVMGAAIRKALMLHLARLDAERPNALGGKRTHFYGEAARSVNQPELDGADGIKVAITHPGIAQRYFGGTLRPVKKQWLAIPARTEAYGHSPLEHHDLHVVLFRKNLAALVQNEQTRITIGRRRKDGTRNLKAGETTGGGIFYWLKKEVTQQEDKTVLPPEADLETAALTEGEAWTAQLIRRAMSL